MKNFFSEYGKVVVTSLVVVLLVSVAVVMKPLAAAGYESIAGKLDNFVTSKLNGPEDYEVDTLTDTTPTITLWICPSLNELTVEFVVEEELDEAITWAQLMSNGYQIHVETDGLEEALSGYFNDYVVEENAHSFELANTISQRTLGYTDWETIDPVTEECASGQIDAIKINVSFVAEDETRTDEMWLIDPYTGAPVDRNDEIDFDAMYTFGAPSDGNEYVYAG